MGSSQGDAVAYATSEALSIALDQSGFWVPLPDGTRLDLDEAGLGLLQDLSAAPDSVSAAVQRRAQVSADAGDLDDVVETLLSNGLLVPADGVDYRTRRPRDGGHAPPSGDALGPDQQLQIPIPLIVAVANGFELSGHRGRITVDALGLLVLSSFREPATPRDAVESHRRTADQQDSQDLFEVVDQAHRAGILQVASETGESISRTTDQTLFAADVRNRKKLRVAIDARLASHEDEVRAREAELGARLVPVLPVSLSGTVPPLALGYIFAYAVTHYYVWFDAPTYPQLSKGVF